MFKLLFWLTIDSDQGHSPASDS